MEDQVLKVGIESLSEMPADVEVPLGDIPRRLAGGGILFIVIVIQDKGVEILHLQNGAQVGLLVSLIDDRLLEAMAFLAADVAGILAVCAFVDRLEIVFGIAVCPEHGRLGFLEAGQRVLQHFYVESAFRGFLHDKAGRLDA